MQEKTINKKEYIDRYKSTEAPNNYLKIFNKVALDIQKNKGCSELEISRLRKRPYFLANIAKENSCKSIAEVGTAQGLQFYSFAEYLSEIGGKVFSCDIRDARNNEYKSKYPNTCDFTLGTSFELNSKILSTNEKIDMFFIDGGHDRSDVIRDIANLKQFQSDSPIWVFDDYDVRFGIYEEIRSIEDTSEFSVRINQASEERPNHMLIVWGKM